MRQDLKAPVITIAAAVSFIFGGIALLAFDTSPPATVTTVQAQTASAVQTLPQPQHNGVRGDQAGRDQKPAFETMPPYYGVCEIDFNRRIELYVYPAQGIVRRVERSTGQSTDFPIVGHFIKRRYFVHVNEFGTRMGQTEWFVNQVDFGPNSKGYTMGFSDPEYRVGAATSWYVGWAPGVSSTSWSYQCIVLS